MSNTWDSAWSYRFTVNGSFPHRLQNVHILKLSSRSLSVDHNDYSSCLGEIGKPRIEPSGSAKSERREDGDFLTMSFSHGRTVFD